MVSSKMDGNRKRDQNGALPFVLDGADGDEGDEGTEEDGARHSKQGDLQAAHAADSSSLSTFFII